jgi:hypothetical protein
MQESRQRHYTKPEVPAEQVAQQVSPLLELVLPEPSVPVLLMPRQQAMRAAPQASARVLAAA